MIVVWLGFFVFYLVSGAAWIPREHFTYYQARPKQASYYFAHVLFYSIPLSSLWNDTLPSDSALLAGITLFCVGGWLNIWAVRSNPYFSPAIEQPPEVIRTGAYRLLNHPGYVGMFLLAAGSWLMAGHRLAVFPLIAYGLLLTWRARKESSLLYQ
jgi:protein-S-isoprenylcysteine O-methyltransferase Ste14